MVLGDCPPEHVLVELLEGRLDAQAEEALDEHIDQCELCTALMAELAMLSWPEAPEDAPPQDDAAAPVAERYELRARLGVGGMGVVYEAWDRALERRVAIKLLLNGGAPPEVTERLLREARLLAQLTHPHVLPVYDVSVDPAQRFIVFHFIEGQDLQSWLSERQRNWREVLGLLLQAGRGLAAAHQQGIIHRDFKPQNVMVDAQGHAWLVDFGLGVQRTGRGLGVGAGGGGLVKGRLGLTATGSVMGTPRYMAPEQHRAEPCDARTDIFAFCVSLWTALGGQHPFGGEDYDTLKERVCLGRIEGQPPPDVPPALVALLRRGLEPSPANRPQDMASVLKALEVWWLSVGESESAGLSANAGADLFVGRDGLMERLEASWHRGQQRLWTLEGTAGAGKTHLARQWQARLEELRIRAVFCDLRGCVTSAEVQAAVALALGVENLNVASEEGLDAVLTSLEEGGRTVWILDNAEQALQAVRRCASRWLAKASGLSLLVTSRRALGLPQEVCFGVGPLEVPQEGERWEKARERASVALLLAVARRGHPGFEVGRSQQEAVVALVRLLDGLALALVLAAGRLRTHSPLSLLQRLRRSLGSLRDRSTGVALRAALESSWALLDGQERAGLARLSVLESGFDAALAEAVLSAGEDDDEGLALDILEALLEHNLLTDQGQGRFGILQSVRDFAAQKFAAFEPAFQRQAVDAKRFHLASLTDEVIAARCRGTMAVERARQVLALGGNIRVATLAAMEDGAFEVAAGLAKVWAWCAMRQGSRQQLLGVLERLSGEATLGAERCGELAEWMVHLLYPGEDSQRAQQLALASHREAAAQGWAGLRARLAYHLGSLAVLHGEMDEARGWYKEAIEGARSLGHDWLVGQWRGSAGRICAMVGELDKARESFEAALLSCQRHRDRLNAHIWMHNLARLHMRKGEVENAQRLFEEILPLVREVKDAPMEAQTLNALAMIHKRTGQWHQAQERYRQALALHRRLGDLFGAALVQSNLGNLYLEAGRLDEARGFLMDASRLARGIGSADLSCVLESNQASLELRAGVPELALRKYESALDITRKHNLSRWVGHIQSGQARALLEQGQFQEAAQSARRALDAEQSGTWDKNLKANLHHLLGTALVHAGDHQGADQHLQEAQRMAIEQHAKPLLGQTLCSLGLLSAAQGQPEDAQRLWQEARSIAWENHTHDKSDLGRSLLALQSQLSPPTSA